MSRTTAAAAATGLGVVFRPPFTASQWEELEHQALIFKYFIAGIPVPHELLLPIRRSYESMTARLYSHPSLGYCSYYGKKLDPEPGRCRRTDGKKWRCSKDAFQDSKYCERHMHRGRNRSRKHVETSQAVPPPPSSFSTERSVAPSSAGRGGGASLELSFHSIGTSPSKVQVDPVSYGMSAMGTAKEFRYLYEPRAELDKCHPFSEAFGSLRASPSMHSAVDISYLPVVPSPLPSFPPSKEQIDSFLSGSNCVRLQPMQDPGHQYHQNSFFGSDFIEQPVKSVQPLLPFFDEWPRTHNSWSELEDERASQATFTTTQLSISIPMVSSDFSTTTSLSQNGSSSP